MTRPAPRDDIEDPAEGASGPAALAPSVAAGPVHAIGEIGLQQFAPYLMNRIMGRYNATLRDTLKQHGVTTAQMRALAVLAALNGPTLNELAVYSVFEQSTMSRTLDTMAAAGWVRREASDSDNRVRRIYLTDAGRALFETLWPTMWEAFSAMFRGVGDSEYATFLSVLHRMLRNVRHHEF
ncbi:MarR family winged helix-turn-helix transcriptional regulator [Acidimangrovimonas sediminis]|uniref:MarR family winged helix-turn-helix transcriptional regulator n=1 Tax=Acidimangrovimonas sediminis TaxID=2056283 RepID=UPI000C7F9882|nr:MarR family winged helix-turn-helix transcriptional regulator [Acidimangrovimonas sediminis]